MLVRCLVPLALLAACTPPPKRPIAMTQLEAPAPPPPDTAPPPEPTAPAADATPLTQSKGPRPAACNKVDPQPEALRTMAVGETLTLPPGIVQYASFDDPVLDAAATEEGLRLTALKPGRVEFWYVDASHKCTLLVIESRFRSVG